MKQHQGNPHELPDRDEGQRHQGGSLQTQPRPEVRAQAGRAQQASRDTPQGAEDQLPDEADDHKRQHGRREEQRPVDGQAGEAPRAEQRRQQQPDRILHEHVDGEEDEVVPHGAPEPRRIEGVGDQAGVVLQPHEHDASAFRVSMETQSQGIEQRVDHERGIDGGRGQDEYDDMEGNPAEAWPHAIRHRRHGPAAGTMPRRRSVPPIASGVTSWAA